MELTPPQLFKWRLIREKRFMINAIVRSLAFATIKKLWLRISTSKSRSSNKKLLKSDKSMMNSRNCFLN